VTPDEFLAAVTFERKREQVEGAHARGVGQQDADHVLGAPLVEAEHAAFRDRFPGVELPADLLALVRRWNGIHLWADPRSGRGYQGLAPVREWDLARRVMWGPEAKSDSLADHYLALSYDTDGAVYVVLNARSGKYFWMDSCGADESCPIGDRAEDLLEWLWQHRI
jgi:hypothetical protein